MPAVELQQTFGAGLMGTPGVHGNRLATLSGICAAFQLRTLEPQLRACEEMAGSSGLVEVAVLGQFKSGKSSFLNSLVGFEGLPVDVLPSTAVVTRVGFGEKEAIRVHYATGESQEAAFGELADFVTERGNPGNQKQVETVEVEFPGLASFPAIRFVDTPGLGSAFAHNTEASMAWLPRVGGALLVVSVDRPPGEQDLNLLEAVLKHTPEVSILLTKADLVTEEQLEAIIKFSRERIVERIGRELPVLPYSIRPGFEGMRGVVLDVLHGIESHRQELHDTILGHKIHGLAEACRAYLGLAERAAQSAAMARSELVQSLVAEKARLQSLDREIRLFTQDLKVRTREALDRKLQSAKGEVAWRLVDTLRAEMRDWDGNLAQRSQRFQDWLENSLKVEMSAVSHLGRELVTSHLVDAKESLQRTVRAFQDRLAAAIEKALALSFEGAEFQLEVREPAEPDIRIGKVFETQWDLLWFLIPMRVFGPMVTRHFLRLVPWETEKQLSRLANQWAETMKASLESLASKASAFMREELAALESMATSSEDRLTEIQTSLRSLDAMSSAKKNQTRGD